MSEQVAAVTTRRGCGCTGGFELAQSSRSRTSGEVTWLQRDGPVVGALRQQRCRAGTSARRVARPHLGAGPRGRPLRSWPRRRGTRTQARAGETGYRVERRLGDGHDDSHRAEAATPMRDCGIAGVTMTRSPARRDRRAPACSASPARPASRAQGASSVAIVTPAAIDSTSASIRNDDSAPCEARRDIAPGLTATADDIGITAPAHAGLGTMNLREELLELTSAVGVDLGHRQRVGIPTTVEETPSNGAIFPRRSTRYGIGAG